MTPDAKQAGNQRSIGLITAAGLILAALILALGFSTTARADDQKARDLMDRVDKRDDGDNQTTDMEMILIDKRGQKRVRKLKNFQKDKGEDTYRLMFFLHPADVKDTGFLTYDYDEPEKDDDQWLYLPALNKTKRIASSDKSGSFMGSDLNYSDMTSRDLVDYDFFWKKEVTVDGNKCRVIETVPRSETVIDETGYEKSLLIVRPDIDMVVRAVHWESNGHTLKYIDVRTIEKIDGIWVATETHVARKRNKKTIHQTVLRLHNTAFGQDLDYDLFTVRRLEKGL